MVEQTNRTLLRRVFPQWPTDLADARKKLVPASISVLRATAVTTIAYVLSLWLLPGRIDLTGALTALLVLHASVHGSLQNGMLRVLAVVIGVGMALGVSALLGLHWYSLFIVVFAALVIGQLMDFGEQTLEIPISAMLILGSIGADVAGWNRIASTLIGTFVGIVFPIVLPPRVPLRETAAAVAGMGRALEQVFGQAAEQISAEPLTRGVIDSWQEATRDASGQVITANERIQDVLDMRRFNVSHWRFADVVPILRDGVEALDQCTLSTRALWTVLGREVPAEATSDPYGHDIRAAFSLVFAEIGQSIGRYGDLVEAQALGNVAGAQTRLANSLDSLQEARAMLAELVLIVPADTDDQERWLLRSSVLVAVDQILALLDLQTRLERFEVWRASQIGYELPDGAIGPRIRTPWGRAAQRRLHRRAAVIAREQPCHIHDLSDDTTEQIPVVDRTLLESRMDAKRRGHR